jgi:hypothetical protein
VETRLDRTPDGRRWVVTERFARPPADAWDRLVDTAAWPEWGPSVAAVEASERHVVAGTTGRVRVARLGVWLPFEVTGCADRRWTWRVAGVPATGHRVEAVAGSHGSVVGIEVPPVAAPYVPVCRCAVDRIAGLAQSVPSGR